MTQIKINIFVSIRSGTVMQEFALRIALYLAPMYFANSSAMLLGGKTPLDLGSRFLDGKPFLGKGKTFKGTILGIAAGTIASATIFFLFSEATLLLTANYLLLGFLLSVGAIAGDMIASFFKRRVGVQQGMEVLFLDQLDFVAGGAVLGSIVYIPSAGELLVAAIITLAAHKFSNYVAFKAKLKKVPW